MLLLVGKLIYGVRGGGGEDEAATTRYACTLVIEWHDGLRDHNRVISLAVGAYQHAQTSGWPNAENIFSGLIRDFTTDDETALTNWYTSEPCQSVSADLHSQVP